MFNMGLARILAYKCQGNVLLKPRRGYRSVVNDTNFNIAP